MLLLFLVPAIILIAGVCLMLIPEEEDKKNRERTVDRKKQDIAIIEQMGLKEEDKKILKFYLGDRGFRYFREEWFPFNESPLSHFLIREEEEALLALIKHEEEDEGMMGWVVNDIRMFDELNRHTKTLQKLHNLKFMNGYSEGERLLIQRECFKELKPLLAHIHEKCEPKSTVVRTESILLGVARFDQLASGVSGVSHLKAPYTEMLELLEEKDQLMPDVIQKAEQTLEEIEGLIEMKRHQAKIEKSWRDNEHILNIRQSIGLSNEEDSSVPQPALTLYLEKDRQG